MVCSVEIFASLHSNVVRRQRRSPPSCYGGCTYKCGFRRRMRNRPTDRAPLCQTPCVRVRNFRGTEFLFNSRDSNRRAYATLYIPPPPLPLREIAFTFLIDYRRVISTFPSNFRTRESSGVGAVCTYENNNQRSMWRKLSR